VLVAKRKSIRGLTGLLPSIRQDIDDAVDFMDSEFSDEFEKGDRYFNGEVDIPVEEGRSSVVSTQVRDTIRNLRPSIMRVLLSNRRRIVQYVPSNLQVAAVIEQQQAYVHQLFWASDGYRVLYDATDESLKHRMGPVKTYWEADPAPEYARLTMLTLDEVQFLSEMPGVKVLEVVPTVGSDYENQAGGEELEFYDVECERSMSNGRICMEAIPYGEFFISRNARTTKDARVHGHRRSITVAEAIDMGLEHDDWWSLDDLDPEQEEVAQVSEARRGYQKREETERGDILSHRFLLTEAYVLIDLEDAGSPQLYCLYLGGTGYELLEKYRESESPFDLIQHDPRAFGVIGTSIPDITMMGQDVMTSILRGMVDNVHMANNPRLAGNPSLVNFDDMMNWNIGYPIRMKGQGTTVQVIQIPSQIQSTMPMLQYLEQDSQNKVGVTKAAQGLDPNAMQSTDKAAVQNTIQLAQGQTELCVRNIIETGVVSIFRKLLKLSIQHLDRIQIVQMRGMAVPVDQVLFDPNLMAQPQVGLGTVTDEQYIAGLGQTLQTQMGIMKELGTNNPFVQMTHIYNTLEDITEAFGLFNVSRYYNMVTPEVEAQFAKAQAEQMAKIEAAKKGQQMDPSIAVIETEKIKAGTEKLKTIVQARSKALELKLKAIEIDAKDDLERDKMAQERSLSSAELLGNLGVKVDQNAISREQNAARAPLARAAAGGDGPASPSAAPAEDAEVVPTVGTEGSGE
jgi:hypothetical protein